MNRKMGFLFSIAVCMAISFYFGMAQAAPYDDDYPQEIEEIPDTEAIFDDKSNADEWFYNSSDGAKGKYSQRGSEGLYGGGVQGSEEQEGKKGKDRFEWILSDGTYQYYMDRQSSKWVRLPYSASEYMIDVWICLISTGADSIVEEYDSEGNVTRYRKYFLEHYYIRPQTQQIQFLCELEVTGRPQNTISQREYNVRNWENLIPGTIEDEIYRAVVKRMGKSKSSGRGHMGFFDMLDEYARIGLN